MTYGGRCIAAGTGLTCNHLLGSAKHAITSIALPNMLAWVTCSEGAAEGMAASSAVSRPSSPMPWQQEPYAVADVVAVRVRFATESGGGSVLLHVCSTSAAAFAYGSPRLQSVLQTYATPQWSGSTKTLPPHPGVECRAALQLQQTAASAQQPLLQRQEHSQPSCGQSAVWIAVVWVAVCANASVPLALVPDADRLHGSTSDTDHHVRYMWLHACILPGVHGACDMCAVRH